MAKLFVPTPQTELCAFAIYFTTCKAFLQVYQHWKIRTNFKWFQKGTTSIQPSSKKILKIWRNQKDVIHLQ